MANGPGLGIRLLGELQLLVRGKPVTLPPSRKTRALLGYLVTTGSPQPRERLCDLLWDGPDDPRAALRWSLAKLRPLLDDTGATRLVTDRERVAFVPHEAEVDILSVSAGWAGSIKSASTSDLEALAARFTGEFLEGLDLPACFRFHEWCTAEREKWGALRVADPRHAGGSAARPAGSGAEPCSRQGQHRSARGKRTCCSHPIARSPWPPARGCTPIRLLPSDHEGRTWREAWRRTGTRLRLAQGIGSGTKQWNAARAASAGSGS